METTKQLMKHYPALLGLNIVRIGDSALRSAIEEFVYNILGRPFEPDHSRDELRRDKDSLSINGDFDGDDADDEEEESRAKSLVMYKSLRIGVSVAVTAVTSLLWIPMDVVIAQLCASPERYSSALACAQ